MRRPTILLVDDEPMLLSLFVTALQPLDCEIFESTTVSSAVQLCANPEFTVDLVISDFQMPHLNGVQLADILRAQRPNLDFIFVTGNGEVCQTLAERGFTCLSKPFGLELLRSTVRDRLNQLAAT
jgi:DNA-binding NtrC family response regulator